MARRDDHLRPPSGVDRDAWAQRFVAAIPPLQQFTDAAGGFGSLLERRRDATLTWRDLAIHLERYPAGPGLPTVIFHHGYGAYSALYGPFLARLSVTGINVVAIDRPGHGLSQGRRGDCSVAELAEVTRLVAEAHVPESSRPVVVFGSSAGGMLTSCLVPYLSDLVDGFACHGVHDPVQARRLLGAMLMHLADAVPAARLPFRLLPASVRRGISEVPAVRAWFRPGSDPLATFNPTLRSVFSMTVAYRPPTPTRDANRPVLVMTGGDDGIVPASRTQRTAQRLGVNSLQVVTIDGGHMLLHERPSEVQETLLRWIRRLRT